MALQEERMVEFIVGKQMESGCSQKGFLSQQSWKLLLVCWFQSWQTVVVGHEHEMPSKTVRTVVTGKNTKVLQN